MYGIKKSHQLFIIVTTLLAFGCPVQAIVQAFGLDERTVRAWLLKAGTQSQQVHEYIIGRSQLDLGQVQADEIKVKTQRGTIWMALAMMVSTRLWLGGVISPRRDKALISALADKIRGVALCRSLLLAVDGLSSYVDAFRKAFRTPLRLGQCGRPRLIAWDTIHIVQVVKRRSSDGLSIQRRIVQGCETVIAHLLQQSQNGGVINTAFIERLNATFRQRLAGLTRRTRHLTHKAETLQAGMFLVGTVYNFCSPHKSLRLKLWISERRYRWVQRTPAMAAGLTDHHWTMAELLSYKIAPPPYVPPKRRGPKPKQHFGETIS